MSSRSASRNVGEPGHFSMPRWLRATLLAFFTCALAAGAWVYFQPPDVENPGLPSPAVIALEAKLAETIAFDAECQGAGGALQALAQKYELNVTVGSLRQVSGNTEALGTRITHHLPRITLGNAIRLIAWEMDPKSTLLVRDDGVHIMTREDADKPLEARFFPTASLMARLGIEEDELIETIVGTVNESSWDSLGGPGHLEVQPGGMVVANGAVTIAEVEQLLATLERLAVGGDAKAADLNPTDTAESTDVYRRLRETLKAEPEFGKVHSLRKVLELMERQTGVPVALDLTALEAVGANPDAEVRGLMTDISWGDSLRLLLAPLDLTFQVRHGAVCVTSPEAAGSEVHVRAYYVGDLVSDRTGASADDLIELITSQCAPESWPAVAGKPPLYMLGNLLIFAQTENSHTEIEALLENLRRALVWNEKAPSAPRYFPELSAAEQELQAVLDRKISLDVNEMPLRDVVSLVRQKAGVTIVIDEKAVDASVDSLITLKRNDWPLKYCLASMLRPLDSTFVVRGGIIYVTTSEEAERLRVTRVYDIAHLVDPLQGLFEPATLDEVTEAVQMLIAPDSWDTVGGHGAIGHFGGLVVITHSPAVQAQVAALFAGLTRYQNGPASLAPFDIPLPTDLPPPPPEVQAKLAETVSWEFADKDFLELNRELREKFGIAFHERDISHLKGVRFACRCYDVPMSQALELIIRDFGCAAEVDYDELLLEEKRPLTVRLYPAPDFPNERPPTSFGATASRINSFIALMNQFAEPTTWEPNNALGQVIPLRHAYLVSERRRGQREIEQFFTEMRTAKNEGRNAEAPKPVENRPDDSVFARKISLDTEPGTVAELALKIAHELKIGVYCTGRVQSSSVAGFHVQETPLADVLVSAVKDREFNCTLQHGVLVFDELGYIPLETRVYSVSRLQQCRPAPPNRNKEIDGFTRDLNILTSETTVPPAFNGFPDAYLWNDLQVVRHTTLGQYASRVLLDRLKREASAGAKEPERHRDK